MGKTISILITVLTLFVACDIKLKPFEDEGSEHRIEVCRYDRLESQYLTTGDFSALQQMNMDYPIETRTLLEDVLRIGEVNDPQISHKFLAFFKIQYYRPWFLMQSRNMPTWMTLTTN